MSKEEGTPITWEQIITILVFIGLLYMIFFMDNGNPDGLPSPPDPRH